MKQCPHCQGNSFVEYNPMELLDLYDVVLDEEITIVCEDCQQDITEFLQFQDKIEEIENLLKFLPKFNEKFLEINFYTNLI